MKGTLSNSFVDFGPVACRFHDIDITRCSIQARALHLP